MGHSVIKVALRRVTEDHKPILFFYEAGELYCYQHVGQHSPASVEYMRDKTYPVKEATATKWADMRLLNEWLAQPPGTKYRLVQRLSKDYP